MDSLGSWNGSEVMPTDRSQYTGLYIYMYMYIALIINKRDDLLPIGTHTILCDDLLPNSLQLRRATARNWRTGKFEHASYRISKRYFSQ